MGTNNVNNNGASPRTNTGKYYQPKIEKWTKQDAEEAILNFKKLKEDGHNIVLTLRGNHSGVSYDYMDDLAKRFLNDEETIFYDKNKDGFTNADKKALGQEFYNVFKEQGYSTNFKRMKVGDQFEITPEQYERLANAAGWFLKEGALEDKKVESVKMPKLEPVKPQLNTKMPDLGKLQIKPIPVQAPQTNEDQQVTIEFTREVIQDGDEVISETFTSNVEGLKDGDKPAANNQIGNLFSLAGGAASEDSSSGVKTAKQATEPDAMAAQAPVDTPLASSAPAVKPALNTEATGVDEKAEATAAAQVAAGAKTAQETIVANMEAIPELAGKTGKERVSAIRGLEAELQGQINELSNAPTYQTKKFLFWGGKTKEVELTQEEQAQRQQQLEALKQQQHQLGQYEVYARDVEGESWKGQKYSHDNYGISRRVMAVSPDGKAQKAIEINNDRWENGKFIKDRKYYAVDVQFIERTHANGKRNDEASYWAVVQDENNELKGYKLAEDQYDTSY